MQKDIGRHVEFARGVSAGLVEREHSVGARGNTAADLVEVMLHGDGIGARKHERRAGVACRTDRAEQIGVGVVANRAVCVRRAGQCHRRA